MIIKLRQMNFVFGFPKQGNLISIKYDEKLQISERALSNCFNRNSNFMDLEEKYTNRSKIFHICLIETPDM